MQHSFILTFFLFFTCLFQSYGQQYSWEKLKTEPYRGKQDDIFFITETQGWYVNGYGRIYRTLNRGESWEQQIEKKGTFFRCIAFSDSLTGYAGTVGTGYFPNVTDTIPLYKTIDGGRNWEPVKYSGKTVKGLCAIEIVKEPVNNHGELGYRNHIFAVGRVGSPANFMVSHDNGQTFSSQDMSQYCSALYDIKMFNTREGFACASTGADLASSHAVILYTKDGGQTWEKKYESKRPYENSWKVFFPTRKTGYATIQSYNPDTTINVQRFIKTVNGGKKWKEYELVKDQKARSFGVGFTDEKEGYIGTMASGYHTTDGGKTWKKTDLGRACNKIRIIRQPDGRIYGYAIGVNIYKLIKN